MAYPVQVPYARGAQPSQQFNYADQFLPDWLSETNPFIGGQQKVDPGQRMNSGMVYNMPAVGDQSASLGQIGGGILGAIGGGQGNSMADMYKMNWGDMGTYGKMATIGQGLSAFSDLAGLYASFKTLGMQKDALRFQKQSWNKNYANQVKDYDNQLKDQYAARSAGAAARGKSYESMDSYLGGRRLTGA